MLKALILSIRQLSDPAIRRVLVRCVLLALLTFVLLVAGVGLGLSALDPTGLAWLDGTLAVLGSLGAVVLAWLLFPIVIAVSLGLFADEVIEAVERRYYPDLPPAPGMALDPEHARRAPLRAGRARAEPARAAAVSAARREPDPVFRAQRLSARARIFRAGGAAPAGPGGRSAQLRRAARARLWWAGVWIAALLTVPVLNLIAPVIATCFMVHLFEGLCRRGGPAQRLRVGAAGAR